MRSIRIFTKNMDDPYYEPTVVVHDNTASITTIRLQVAGYRI